MPPTLALVALLMNVKQFGRRHANIHRNKSNTIEVCPCTKLS